MFPFTLVIIKIQNLFKENKKTLDKKMILWGGVLFMVKIRQL